MADQTREQKIELEALARIERKRELRALHCGQVAVPVTSDKGLDSSLKKNSAMVSKLKTVNEDTWKKLRDELLKLKFEKFIQEFVSALVEASLKVKSSNDMLGMLEVFFIFILQCEVAFVWRLDFNCGDACG